MGPVQHNRVRKQASILWYMLDLLFCYIQAAEEVIWAYDFRFSPEVFWYPIIFVFYFNFFGEIGYEKTSW